MDRIPAVSLICCEGPRGFGNGSIFGRLLSVVPFVDHADHGPCIIGFFSDVAFTIVYYFLTG